MKVLNCPSEDASTHYNRSLAAYQAHVEACLSQCIGIEQRSEALHLKGAIAMRIERYEEAKACFEYVAQASPSSKSYQNFCAALMRCREFKGAAIVARCGLALSMEQDSPS